ncbi:hypothetical protein Bbelb_348110 [Branchiostoma belcheri]|nr:hypothetical protein Bbelb_348110 [Branchiostoma belcheri]
MATFVDSNGKIHSCELCLKYPETPECLEQCPTTQDPSNSGKSPLSRPRAPSHLGLRLAAVPATTAATKVAMSSEANNSAHIRTNAQERSGIGRRLTFLSSPTVAIVAGLSVVAVLVVVVLLVLAALWWYRRKHAPLHHDHNAEAPVQEQDDLLTKPKYVVNHANTQTHEPVEVEQRPLAGPEPVEDDYLPIRETAEGTSISHSPHTFT